MRETWKADVLEGAVILIVATLLWLGLFFVGVFAMIALGIEAEDIPGGAITDVVVTVGAGLLVTLLLGALCFLIGRGSVTCFRK